MLRLIAAGYAHKEIAARLSLSAKTVDAHKANAMRKLDLNGRIDVPEPHTARPGGRRRQTQRLLLALDDLGRLHASRHTAQQLFHHRFRTHHHHAHVRAADQPDVLVERQPPRRIELALRPPCKPRRKLALE